MAASLTRATEEEYLATGYEPDCEFADGVLIERNVGTEKHSWMQAALAAFIFRRRKAWGVNVYTEQRTKLRRGKYKLPDVCIVAGPRPAGPIFDEPPLVAIEILSPEDRPLRVDQAIADCWNSGSVMYGWSIRKRSTVYCIPLVAASPSGMRRYAFRGLRSRSR